MRKKKGLTCYTTYLHCRRNCGLYFGVLLLAGLLFYTYKDGDNMTAVVSSLPSRFHYEMKLMEEMDALLNSVQLDDHRLVRWDATEETMERQLNGGCHHEKLQKAFDLILDYTFSDQLRGRAAEYLTFCITDNSDNREFLSQQEGIHEAIIDLAQKKTMPLPAPNNNVVERGGGSLRAASSTSASFASKMLDIDETSYGSAMACHLLYIATFANAKNHAEFQKHNAVAILSTIIHDYDIGDSHSTTMTKTITPSTPIQAMWAAAALQNLAASYCNTKNDGRCYWDWSVDDVQLADPLEITQKSLPMTIDGAPVRQALLGDMPLIEKLFSISCSGPVSEPPFPGESALVHRDELVPSIVPWATSGVLKNLALHPAARSPSSVLAKLYQDHLPCLCRLSHSPDWLEADKGESILYNVRRGDPCWFDNPHIEQGKEGSTATTKVCIDHVYYDAEGYTCSDFNEDPSEEDCSAQDRHGILARKACCACQGGTTVED